MSGPAGPAPAPATATLPALPVTATPAPATATGVATRTPAPTPFVPPDLRYLVAAFDEVLAGFDGLGSYFVVDLDTGQALGRNDEVAFSGMSLVKIPILLETYRVLDGPPTAAQTKLITETATLSSNYAANLLLELIAGRPDPFAGAEQVTRSLRDLGIYNTFIAVPYDKEAQPQYLATYLTPANQRQDLTTNPDPNMQTTVRDLGRLLQMIYECVQGNGPLLQQDAQQLTTAECSAVLDVLRENHIEAFIEAGVPKGVPVAHKHGWVGDTHGDAAVVFAPGHDYVLAVALHRPGWLEWADSTAVIAELSRLAYAHFTDPDAYPAALLATPLPTMPPPTATPNGPQAVVGDTRGVGLTLRDAPGGAELAVLPEGTLLFLLDEKSVTEGGFTWRRVQAPGALQGWVVSEFLLLRQAP
jgi:beta-lactamase class A